MALAALATASVRGRSTAMLLASAQTKFAKPRAGKSRSWGMAVQPAALVGGRPTRRGLPKARPAFARFCGEGEDRSRSADWAMASKVESKDKTVQRACTKLAKLCGFICGICSERPAAAFIVTWSWVPGVAHA
eukprot:s1485_g15.t1